MAKRIKWTENALREKYEIFKYWNKKNDSDGYSKKLNLLFKNALKSVSEHPSLARPTEDPVVTNILVRDYLLYFIESDKEFIVVHIWDGRRNPDTWRFKSPY